MAKETERTLFMIHGLTDPDGKRYRKPYFKQAYSWKQALDDALANDGVRERVPEDVHVVDFSLRDDSNSIKVQVESRWVDFKVLDTTTGEVREYVKEDRPMRAASTAAGASGTDASAATWWRSSSTRRRRPRATTSTPTIPASGPSCSPTPTMRPRSRRSSRRRYGRRRSTWTTTT